MKKYLFILAAIGVIALSITAYYIRDNKEGISFGAFGDPFKSIQLAISPNNGNCLSTDGINNIWTTCGSGGGGGAGTFSTTTYNGRLLQYPYTTLITSLDGSATTTSDFWFDPFISKTFFSYGSTTALTASGNVQTPLVTANSSAGLIIEANNGTDVGLFGAGNSANTSFYGGVNIDGATRLATSLTGILKASSGTVSTASAGTDYENPLTFSFPLIRSTNTITWGGLSTTTSLTTGHIPFVSGVNTFSSRATTSVTCSGTVSCTGFDVLGSSPITITGSGGGGGSGNVATSSAETSTYIPFWSSTSATPATLSGGTSNFTWNGTRLFANYASTTSFTTTGGAYFATSGGNVGISTTTVVYPLTVFSATLPQLALSDGAGDPQWTFRNAGGNFYLSTTTVAGTATTSTAALELRSSGTPFLAIGTSSPTSLGNNIFASQGSLFVGRASTVTLANATSTFDGNIDVLGTIRSAIITATTRIVAVISAAFTPAVEGEFGIDTTSNQFKYLSGGSVRVLTPTIYSTFTYSTSTSFTGTTTIPLGVATVAETWQNIVCFTDTGTAQVSVNDGTNRMNFVNASTTANLNVLSTSNSFTALEKRYVDIGTPGSSPTKVSCTIGKTINAD